jgi:hemoglobin
MPDCRRCGLVLVALTALAMLSPEARAQDMRALDNALYDMLKDVINNGADIYNAKIDDGDFVRRDQNRAACFGIYQGSLLTVRPLLRAHPTLQKAIDDGIAKAAGQRSFAERAFTLRAVLDDVRKELKTSADGGIMTGPVPTPEGGVTPGPAPTPEGGEGKSLWDRLGGAESVQAIVNNWINRVIDDPRVNFTRGGKIKMTDGELAAFKKKMVDYISGATGGVIRYGGNSMKAVHAKMGITDMEFDAMMEDLSRALQDRKVKTAEGSELLKIIQSTRGDIVEVRKR